MNRNVTRTVALVVALGLGLGLGLTLNQAPPARAQADKGAVPGRYTVVETEGTNLLVTDDHTNSVYFYAVDRDQPAGSDLKLRGTVDLNKVGKPVIKPQVIKEKE
jgi:hypothetical protein